ncbi:broad-complex core protein isoforms 1/2/3/4/5 isoform X3 [Rhagoletis pomonella]|uniref:broad-complex core protein isoforms 1/2/3/4/5 isoform X3 n=1 Tax=Rhagoletis pomonella TaxID=28610 RepID=UPI00177DE41E|nr:broad-complex core protein isoforms 1/2/3/4/5 isoform X3 [Rhagoletis pomonella]
MASRSHQYFSLRWNNYQNTMTSVFQQLREDLSFVDVTLSCEHGSLKAHKVVLSACSSYFQKLLLENPCKHPTIILPGDIIFTDLKTIIDFVYRGEIDVTESELQGLLRTAEQLKIKGLCETAENTDDLNDTATATITVSENIQQAVVGNIVNTTVSPGQASPNTQHQQQQQQQHQQQQQIATNTAVLTHNIGNVPAANSQQIGSSATANANATGQLVVAGSTSSQQPQIGRKSRVRKRSKSPDLQQQQQLHNTQQQVQQHPQTILIQNQNQAAIVSLQQTSSGNYIPVSGVQTVTTSVAGQQQAVITGDESDTEKPTLSKICKTEAASASPASSGSGVSGSNNAGSVTTVAAPGTAIVTQIVVARDVKDKNMTSLGMGMNGGILGVPMGFLDFAPEPPAPSATPVTVTEHVDLSCNPNTDTRDLSNPTEALDIDNHLAQHMIQRLDQSPMHAMHHQTGDESNSNLVQHIKSEVIEAKQQQQQQQQQQHHQSQQHQLHAQQLTQTQAQQQQHQQHQVHQQQTSHSHSTHSQQQAQSHQDISGATVMEIDPSQIKHEPGMIITPEIVNMMTTGHMDMYNSDTSEDSMMIANGSPNDQNEPHYTNLDQQHVDIKGQFNGPKTWTQDDMNSALDALKNQNMSLTKASVTYGIPSTTLWQRAHRMGIETPKKEGGTKSWNEDSLNNALEALRSGQISANKASKAFGIPSSTLYKIARREGIRLAAPFNAAPTTWTPEDLERALEAIRAGHTSVQKASAEFGIPTGTLYGRCKREGIELSRSNPTPWSEDAMNEALNSVRIGQMSINQAAIHYNLPYSSLYGRFKRGKYDVANTSSTSINNTSGNTSGSIEIIEHSQENSFQYSPSPHQQPQHGGQTQSQTPQHLTQHVVHIQQSQTHHQQQQVHAQQQQHIQQQQDVVTSSSQVAHSSAAGGQQQQQIQQIYHHHSTPERS